MSFLSAFGLNAAGFRRQAPGAVAAARLFERGEDSVRSPISVLFPLIIAGTLFLLSRAENTSVRHLQILISDVGMPLVDGASRAFNKVTGLGNFFRSQMALHQEIEILKTQNANLLMLQTNNHQIRQDIEDLKRLANFVQNSGMASITAPVVGQADDGYSSTLFVRATERDGVEKHQPVISAQGLIGRVAEVTLTGARILPLTDSTSRIPVQTDAGHQAIVAGQNSQTLDVRYLESASQVKVGDRLYTSGHGGLFPRGLPVAVVTAIDGDRVTASPLAGQSNAVVSVILQ
jgi:rod shape-determining protein MreC